MFTLIYVHYFVFVFFPGKTWVTQTNEEADCGAGKVCGEASCFGQGGCRGTERVHHLTTCLDQRLEVPMVGQADRRRTTPEGWRGALRLGTALQDQVSRDLLGGVPSRCVSHNCYSGAVITRSLWASSKLPFFALKQSPNAVSTLWIC